MSRNGSLIRTVFIALIALRITTAAAENSSLAQQSDEELLRLIRGGKSEASLRAAAEIKPHLPENFWTLPPREAALSLVLTNCSDATKERLRIFIADPKQNSEVPSIGEVGIRWEGTGSGPMAGGLKLLRAARAKSILEYSAVELNGDASRKEIAAAVKRTRAVVLPADVAQQAFQVIWWLGRVRVTGDAPDELIFVNHESAAAFWLRPGLPKTKRVRLHYQPGEHLRDTFDADAHASFAELVIDETAKRQPREIEPVTEMIGTVVYPDAGLKFLRLNEQPRASDATPKWIEQTLKILRAPAYRRWHTIAIDNLVPWQEPMRFSDQRIDQALREILQDNLSGNFADGKRERASSYEIDHAARALAWRDCTEVLPLLLNTLRTRRGIDVTDSDGVLASAALLASRHDEWRPAIISYLRAQLSDVAGSKHASWKLFDLAWRYEFRELTPLLQDLATADEDELEETWRKSSLDSQPPQPRHFHAPRKILRSWQELNPLTKLKLDALMEASSSELFRPPDLLQRQFDKLGVTEQKTFREFVEWMKRQELPFNWQPRRVEWAISPEALAAAR